jgi:hypothetical protein
VDLVKILNCQDIYVHYSCLYSSELFYLAIGAFSELISRCKLIDTVVYIRPMIPLEPRRDIAQPVPTALSTRRASMMSVKAANGLPTGAAVITSAASMMDLAAKSSDADAGVTVENQPTANFGGLQTSKGVSTKRKSVAVGSAAADQFNRTDVDMIFISNCITGPKHECNGKRFLNRFQFMDAVVGLAQ